MHDLQLLGVHDDGEHVVFLGADGQRYRVPVDDALRAAVRRDRARLNQLQVSGQSLRPRDIQALVRAGHSAQQIADESGVSLEFVQRFEGPVLAERENIVWRARQTRVRRRDEVGPALGDLADERLEARGVSLGRGTTWDAWREDDGTWTLQVAFTAGGTQRVAQWRYDVGASHLTPADDESKWLTSEHAAERSVRGTGPTRASRDDAAAQHEGALDRVLRRRMETVEFRAPWTEEQTPPAMAPDAPVQDAQPEESAPAAAVDPSAAAETEPTRPDQETTSDRPTSAEPEVPEADGAGVVNQAAGNSDDASVEGRDNEPVEADDEPSADTSTAEHHAVAAEPAVGPAAVSGPDAAAAPDTSEPDSTATEAPNPDEEKTSDTAGTAGSIEPDRDPVPQRTATVSEDRSTSGRTETETATDEAPAADAPTPGRTEVPEQPAARAGVPAAAAERKNPWASTSSGSTPLPTELPPAAHPADSHPEDLPDATVVEPRREQPAAAAKPAIPKPGPRPTRRQTATRKGRASVPSWDDILFGSKKD